MSKGFWWGFLWGVLSVFGFMGWARITLRAMGYDI